MEYLITNNIVELIVLVIIGLLTTFVIPFVKANVSEKKLDIVKDFAEIFVNGIEQKISESGQGKFKKNEVIRMLTDKATDIGLKLTEDEVDMIIENAVKTMKECSVL